MICFVNVTVNNLHKCDIIIIIIITVNVTLCSKLYFRQDHYLASTTLRHTPHPLSPLSFFQRMLRFCIARERTGEKGNNKCVQGRNRERKAEAFILPRDFVVVP
jgi:hypothetical protein